MALQFDSTLFDSIHHCNYSVVYVENPAKGQGDPILKSEILKITVVDSGCTTKNPPLVAAVFVPTGRENDWVFSTPTGCSQLTAKFYGISRLILVGNISEGNPKHYRVVEVNEDKMLEAEEKIRLTIAKFIPLTLRNGEYKILFLKFNDGLVFRSNIANSTQPTTALGNFSIHEEVVKTNRKFEVRKILRYKNTGNWIHCETRLVGLTRKSKKEVIPDDKTNWERLEFKVDNETVVDPLCAAMLNGLSLIAMKKERYCLCLGGNAAVLSNFLANKLNFKTVWVEYDNGLFEALKTEFKVENCNFFNLHWKCIIKQDDNDLTLSAVARRNLAVYRENWDNVKFDVIMIALNEADACSFSGQAAPPRDLIREEMLRKLKGMIKDNGALVIHVNPPDYPFYAELLSNLKNVFGRKLHKIEVSEKNFVIIAIKSGGDGPSHPNAATEEKGVLKSLKELTLTAVGVSLSSAAKEDEMPVLKSIRQFPIEEITEDF